jgi:hypothetical protein
MSKKTFLKMSDKEFIGDSKEVKFDNRLQDKRIEHGFMTEKELKGHMDGLGEESEYDFTSAEALDAEGPSPSEAIAAQAAEAKALAAQAKAQANQSEPA